MKYFLCFLVGCAVGCLALFGVSIVKSPDYTETIDCYVSSRGKQAAIGDVFILTVNGTKTIKVQADQCVNMESAEAGDNFKAVVVRDEDQILQCIVRVGDTDDKERVD